MPVPGLADIWDYPPSDEDSADPLVLGRVLNDHGQARRVRSTSAASVGPNLLRDRLSALRRGARSAVPLADRAIGNLQQWLIGTYHGVSKDQLQVYLDEFVFRHNRRKTPAAAFQTLLGLGTGRTSTEYEQIRGARDLNPNLLGLAEATR